MWKKRETRERERWWGNFVFLFKLERFIDITLNTQHKKKKRKKVRADDDDDEVERFIYLGEITLVNSLRSYRWRFSQGFDGKKKDTKAKRDTLHQNL